MKTRKQNPLAKGSVEPSQAVVHVLTDMVSKEACSTNQLFLHGREENVLPAVYDLYDAMILWMGPGGDPSFLDFYLLENGRLPEIDLISMTDREKSSHLWSKKGSNGRIASLAATIASLSVIKLLPFSLNELLDPRTSDGSLLYGVSSSGNDHIWQAVPLSDVQGQDQVIFLGMSVSKFETWTSFLAVPRADFRKKLMSELAQPWERPGVVPSTTLKPPRVVRRPGNL